MSDTQDLDSGEAATPFKLQKARERGQTPRSADMVSSVVFMAAMLYVAGQGLQVTESLLQVFRSTLVQAAQVGPAGLWPLVAHVLDASLLALLPFLLVLPVAAVLGAMAQTGFVFSTHPVHMDFQRLNPASGFQRLFSLRTAFDGLRACIKLLVLGSVAAVALQVVLPQFHALATMPPATFLQTMTQDVASLGIKMGMALLVVSAIDMAFTRHEFGKNMRMSRREVKDEHRNREGDPRIRGRLRELRRELLQRSQALRNTRDADVVLTNPTHYAVALRYVHGEMDAPRVVAKGAGQLAAAMREIAARHRVVVVQNPPLARRLFRESAIDAYIPAATHAEVARIIVWVFALRQQRGAAAGAGA
ncbi:MAG: EscU/YscU/HrcU family type III secretion system export apparatus switch protein [Comamonadaceae bacterium]|nr:MAG: EscU/YscU/HrcU family type III secretion system export apparatus switch protein [Comamonadaceae bacterium]